MGRAIGVLVTVLILTALLLPPASSAKADEPRPQVRAFWVDAFHNGAKTPEQIDKLISDALEANINTLVVQVRRRGDTYYFSDIDPRTEDPVLPPEFDALQYLIDKAHAQGLEVHAWLNTLSGWNSPIYPKAPNHVWNLHGPLTTGDQNWVSYVLNTSTGKLSSSYYLDPGHPACADYVTSVYLEVVRKYDVDGIHLDYARYNGTNYGYNAVAVARFNEQFGRTGLPAPTDPAWMAWRREQVTNLMRKIYLGAIAIKPDIKVSCATIAWGAGPVNPGDWEKSRTMTEAFQDWKGWLEEGIIDLAMPMNYDREWRPATERIWYDQWIEWEKNLTHNRQVVIGPALYLQYPEMSLDQPGPDGQVIRGQISRALAPSSQGKYAAGVSLYSYASTNLYGCDDYKTGDMTLPRKPHVFLPATNDLYYPLLSHDGGYTDPVLNTYIPTLAVFPTPAAIPDMPWKSAPTKGFLMGTVADFNGATYDHLQVKVINQQTGETREVFTDGSGWYGLADLTPGHYRVTIGKEDFVGRRQIEAWVKPGLVTEANFAQFWQKGQSGFRCEQLDIDDSIPPEPAVDPDGDF